MGVLPLLIVAQAVQQAAAGKSKEFVIYLLLLAPLAAGTGLLARGREGRLDLLLAAGVSRRRVGGHALGLAVGLPLLLVWVSSGVAFGFFHTDQMVSAAAFLMTGGICFLCGLGPQRALPGVVWMFARFALFASPVGMKLRGVLKVQGWPEGLAEQAKMICGVLVFPEVLLEAPGRPLLTCAFALIGVLAATLALFIFEQADLNGRRTE